MQIKKSAMRCIVIRWLLIFYSDYQSKFHNASMVLWLALLTATSRARDPILPSRRIHLQYMGVVAPALWQ